MQIWKTLDIAIEQIYAVLVSCTFNGNNSYTRKDGLVLHIYIMLYINIRFSRSKICCFKNK